MHSLKDSSVFIGFIKFVNRIGEKTAVLCLAPPHRGCGGGEDSTDMMSPWETGAILLSMEAVFLDVVVFWYSEKGSTDQ